MRSVGGWEIVGSDRGRAVRRSGSGVDQGTPRSAAVASTTGCGRAGRSGRGAAPACCCESSGADGVESASEAGQPGSRKPSLPAWGIRSERRDRSRIAGMSPCWSAGCPRGACQQRLSTGRGGCGQPRAGRRCPQGRGWWQGVESSVQSTCGLTSRARARVPRTVRLARGLDGGAHGVRRSRGFRFAKLTGPGIGYGTRAGGLPAAGDKPEQRIRTAASTLSRERVSTEKV